MLREAGGVAGPTLPTTEGARPVGESCHVPVVAQESS